MSESKTKRRHKGVYTSIFCLPEVMNDKCKYTHRVSQITYQLLQDTKVRPSWWAINLAKASIDKQFLNKLCNNININYVQVFNVIRMATFDFGNWAYVWNMLRDCEQTALRKFWDITNDALKSGVVSAVLLTDFVSYIKKEERRIRQFLFII